MELKIPRRVVRKDKEERRGGDDAAIQQTNNDAQVSKLSAVNLGYMKDDFVHYFVAHPVKRSPIINRGYFARSYALDLLINSFLSIENVEKQIISLGAGYDTRYPHLRTPSLVKYIEVDFPDMIASKSDIISRHPDLIEAFGGDLNFVNNEIQGKCYHAIGADLRKLDVLQNKLDEIGIDYSIPTLILSECVLIYLDAENSNQIVKWGADKFDSAVFITYEMILPDDPFGSVMLKNLESRSIALKGIRAYPDIPSQISRYTNLGWEHSQAYDMFHIFNTFTPKKELGRISKLELFDEFEEWELISKHYCISYGTKTSEKLKNQKIDLSLQVMFQVPKE